MMEDPRVMEYLQARADVLCHSGPPKREGHHGGPHYVVDCPFCGKEKHLLINASTTQWDCKVCAASGNLFTMKRDLGDVLPLERSGGGHDNMPIGPATGREFFKGGGVRRSGQVSGQTQQQKRKPLPGLALDDHRRLLARAPGDEAAALVWAWLTDPRGKRGYTEDTIKAFKLGVEIRDCYGDSSVRKAMVGGGAAVPMQQQMQAPGGGGVRARQGATGGRVTRAAATRSTPVAAAPAGGTVVRGVDHATQGAGPGGVCELCGGKPHVVYCSVPFWYKGESSGIKYRSVDPWPKHWARYPGCASTLLRVDEIKLDGTEALILVEGEWDVMAMYQMGWENVTSLQTGAGSHLPDDLAEQIGSVKDLLICYDADGVGVAGAERIANEVGRHRAYLVTLPLKDANECLLQSKVDAVEASIAAAASLAPSGLVKSADLADGIWADICDPRRHYGVSTGWPALDSLWGGVRPHELTVVTGHSGSGKTTWTTMLGANLAKAGEPGLICPFESRVKPGVMKLLNHVAGCDIGSPQGRSSFRQAMSLLENWPIYWLNHYGAINLLQLQETLYYAVNRLGVSWVIFDHLHFMVQCMKDEKPYEAVERTMLALQKWLEELPVHLFLVCHPKGGVDETQRLGQDDLKGGSSVKQIANSIIVVHRPRTKTRRKGKHDGEAIIYTAKCRADVGDEGEVLLLFDKESVTYSDPGDGDPDNLPTEN